MYTIRSDELNGLKRVWALYCSAKVTQNILSKVNSDDSGQAFKVNAVSYNIDKQKLFDPDEDYDWTQYEASLTSD